MPEGLEWEQIIVSDWYRNSNKTSKAKLKHLWMRDVAPQINSDILTNKKAYKAMYKYVLTSDLPDKLPDEDDIITPESLSYDAFTKIERSTLFAGKPYKEQQALKQIWFRRMSAVDPIFKTLIPEDKMGYQMNLMKRAPTMSEGSLLFPMYNPQEITESAMSKSNAVKGTAAFMQNLTSAAAWAAGSLLLGPIRALSGPDSVLTNTIEDAQKWKEWLNVVNAENSQFLTRTLPSVVGYIGGLLGGPFLGMESLLAGGAKLGTKKLVELTPGALETVGKVMGMKVPSILYQTAGGATAGAIQGIGEALTEGKDWKTYIPRDVTYGTVFEFAGRYLGMMRVLSKAAKHLNVDIKSLIKAPLNVSDIGTLPPDMQRLFSVMSEGPAYVSVSKALDKDGLVMDHMDTINGVRMKGEILGYTTEEGTNSIRFLKQGKLVKEITADADNVRIVQAQEWLDATDSHWEVWENALQGKQVMETAATAPAIKTRIGFVVPEEGRNYIYRQLAKHGINLGIGNDLREGQETLDAIYTLIQSASPKKVATTLWDSHAIMFNEIPRENIATIKNMKRDLGMLNPLYAYAIVNGNTGKLVNLQDMPTTLWDSPTIKQPFMNQETFVGKPADIREYLSTLKKQYKNLRSAKTRVAKAKNIDLSRYMDSQIVEMKLQIPNAAGSLHEVTLHFPSIAHAQEAMSIARNRKLKGLAGHIFAGDEGLKRAYNDFVKDIKRTDPEMFKRDFLPYQFMAAQAKQEDFYLGVLNGKYIIQDLIDDQAIKWHTFNTLDEVGTFLRKNDGRMVQPEMAHLAAEAAEELYPKGMKDPLGELEPIRLKNAEKTKYGLRYAIMSRFAPPQYLMQRFEKLAVKLGLDTKFNFSPTEIAHNIRVSTRAADAFEYTHMNYIKKLKGSLRGVNKKESSFMKRLTEAAADQAEIDSTGIAGAKYELRGNVIAEMTEAFGKPRTDQLISAVTTGEQYFDRLFARSGMNWGKFVKRYFPHYAEELRKMKSNLSSRPDPQSFTQIPKVDRPSFFEMARAADPGDVAFSEDYFGMMEMYTHLMGRKLYIRPIMKQMADGIRKMNYKIHKGSNQTGDYDAMINYISDLFGSIEGIQLPSDKVLKIATENTFSSLYETINAKWGTNFKFKGKQDFISKALTWSTGAHIAGRPFLVARNLTQSLVLGGSVIGNRWWAEGLDMATRPGALEELKRLGIIQVGGLPIAGGTGLSNKGILGTAVGIGMKPYKGADWLNRAIVYYGMNARMDSAIALLRAGKMSKKRFARVSGSKLFGAEAYNEGIKYLQVGTSPSAVKNFKDYFSMLASDRTQILYDTFQQPQAFRKGFGRFFGQYTSWPINFYNLAKERLISDTLTAPEKLAYFARLGTSTGAIAYGMHSVGLNPRQFAPWNMITVGGGPYYQLTNDFLRFLNGDEQAYGRLVRGITSLVPFAYEGEGIMRAVQAMQEGDMYEAFLNIASAPISIDVYPRRKTTTDDIERILLDAGKKFFAMKRQADKTWGAFGRE